MSEVCRSPIYTVDENGDELVTFDAHHSLADIARWLAKNRVEAEDMIEILKAEIAGINRGV